MRAGISTPQSCALLGCDANRSGLTSRYVRSAATLCGLVDAWVRFWHLGRRWVEGAGSGGIVTRARGDRTRTWLRLPRRPSPNASWSPVRSLNIRTFSRSPELEPQHPTHGGASADVTRSTRAVRGAGSCGGGKHLPAVVMRRGGGRRCASPVDATRGALASVRARIKGGLSGRREGGVVEGRVGRGGLFSLQGSSLQVLTHDRGDGS
jgi:hypothetical protein